METHLIQVGVKQEKQNPQNTVDVKDYILGTTNKQNKNPERWQTTCVQ